MEGDLQMQMDRPKQARGDALVKDAPSSRHGSVALVLIPRTRNRDKPGIAGRWKEVHVLHGRNTKIACTVIHLHRNYT